MDTNELYTTSPSEFTIQLHVQINDTLDYFNIIEKSLLTCFNKNAVTRQNSFDCYIKKDKLKNVNYRYMATVISNKVPGYNVGFIDNGLFNNNIVRFTKKFK